MSGAEILAWLSGGGVVILVLSLIKVKPLEISVWHWLARQIGKAFNGETLDEVQAIKEDLKAHLEEHEKAKEDRDEDRAETNRQRILRFADEMFEGKYHSREYFEDILEKIDQYEQYCSTHPDFPNGRTVAAAKIIRDQYEECMKKHSFDVPQNT